MRNFIRPRYSRPRAGLVLCEASGSCVQGLKQVIPVFPRRFEYSGGYANVMLLHLCGDLRLVRCRKSTRSTERAGVRFCGSILDGMTRIRCPHLLRSLPGPGSKIEAEIQSWCRRRPPGGRRQVDRIAQPRLLETIPDYSLCFCDFPRFIIQPIAVPAAMPAANVIATVSNGCRCKRLFVL